MGVPIHPLTRETNKHLDFQTLLRVRDLPRAVIHERFGGTCKAMLDSRDWREFTRAARVCRFSVEALTEFVCNPENAKCRPRDGHTGSFRRTTNVEDLLERPEPGNKVGSLGPVWKTSMGRQVHRRSRRRFHHLILWRGLWCSLEPSDGCSQPIVFWVVFWGWETGKPKVK
jgi:hypothetical protein